MLSLLLRIFSWLFFIGAILITGALFWGAAQLVVFDRSVDTAPLRPFLLTQSNGESITSVAEWEALRDEKLVELSELQYGPVPTTEVAWKVDKKVLDEHAFNDRATLEHWTLTLMDSDLSFNLVGVFPKSETPVPLLVGSNFCPNHARFKDYDIPQPDTYPSFCGQESMMKSGIQLIFGDMIDSFPLERFVDHTMAFVSIYLGEGVADDAERAPEGLASVSKATGVEVSGALAAWAWTFIEVTRTLEQDERIDADRTGVYGHSRDGKAALIAAAHSDRIDLVLAHQSGKGGAAPWQTGVGESMEAIVTEYPHWFDQNLTNFIYDESFVSVDQHFLLASIAPRPVLVSGARLDKWGDPAGAARAVYDVQKIYGLYGATGMSATDFNAYQPGRESAFFMRPWFHGVRSSDWDAFFAFLESHF